jgi:hypothetical protein
MLDGERPLWGLIAPTISQEQGRYHEVGAGSCAELAANLRLDEHEAYMKLSKLGELA